MFDLLKEGLEEAVAYERGLAKNVRVKKKRIDVALVPEQPQEYQASDIRISSDIFKHEAGNFLNHVKRH